MASDVPQGYLPPDDAFTRAMKFTLENDPLVNDSSTGIGGWFSKITGLFARSGKTLLPHFAVTLFAPAVVLGTLSGAGGLALSALDLNSTAQPPPELFAGAAVIAVFVGFIAGVMQMMGFAGATYIATREAAGMTVRWTEGLRYGLRRGMGLVGWYTITGLAIALPLVLIASCLFSSFGLFAFALALPLALYAILAAAMVGPAYLFERGNALKRSFGLFHGAPRRMSGRLILVGLAYAVLGSGEQVLALVPATLPGSAPQFALQFAAAVIGAALTTLALMVAFAGILVTYAERRGDEGSLTPDLVDQL